VSYFDSPSAGDVEPEDLRVTTERRGRAVILAVAGEVDMLTAAQLEQRIRTSLASRPQILVVDLSKVEFFSSAGMNVLLSTREVTGETTLFRVVATGSATLRPLQIAGLTEYLAVYESLDAVLTES
jgi:anti-sigma B factor antagonist